MSTITAPKHPTSLKKEDAQKPIVVSKTAYAALKLLKNALESSGQAFVKFPEVGDSKNPSINELLRVKNIIEKRGERLNATYRLKVPFEMVQESQRASKGNATAIVQKIDLTAPAQNLGYRKLPTLNLLSEFIGAVNAESKILSQDRHVDLTRKIAETKKRLATADGDDEHRLLMELNNYYDQRRNIKGELTVEALRNIAAEERFRSIDWSQVVSMNIRDYGTE